MNDSLTHPKVWLRGEGAAMLAVAVFLYGRQEGNWLLFGLLFLTPDLSVLGYLAGNRIGATTYNLFHTYTVPAVVAVVGLVSSPSLIPVALIWMAHIGFDRCLGYGLKLTEGFQHTHLGPIGRKQDRT